MTPLNIKDPNVTLNWNKLEYLCQDCHDKEHISNGNAAKGLFFDENGDITPTIEFEMQFLRTDGHTFKTHTWQYIGGCSKKIGGNIKKILEIHRNKFLICEYIEGKR